MDIYFILANLEFQFYLKNFDMYYNMSDRWVCEYCKPVGKHVTFSCRQALYKHKRANHKELFTHLNKVSTKPVLDIKPKGYRDEIVQLEKKLDAVQQVMIDKFDALLSQPATNITNNITQNNTINIYFNKDLKYYPELVKRLGKETTQNYLLFKMSESKDLFGALTQIFVHDGVSSCPIQLDGNEFIIARGEDKYDTDPTGELIDRENKNKLKDAVMSAYIESTRHLADECEKIRKTRVNGDYSDVDQETINKRFDYLIEPSRPYTVIDTMNAIKPKRKDFDRLRKICPVVIKKPVIN